jgi:hypothetical protein
MLETLVIMYIWILLNKGFKWLAFSEIFMDFEILGKVKMELF